MTPNTGEGWGEAKATCAEGLAGSVQPGEEGKLGFQVLLDLTGEAFGAVVSRGPEMTALTDFFRSSGHEPSPDIEMIGIQLRIEEM